MDYKELLHEEIVDEFDNLKETEAGTEEYTKVVDGLTKLVDRAIKIEEIENEKQEKAKTREVETSLKLDQMKEDKIDRVVRNSLTAAGIIIPTLVTIWGTCKSIKFEETGTFTTIMGRGFINKLLPKK